MPSHTDKKIARQIPHRSQWRKQRLALERALIKVNRTGNRRKRWKLFKRIVEKLGLCLKITGLFHLGRYFARQVKVTEIELRFAKLPKAFDGYRVLHLTDLHFDSYPGIENYISKAIKDHTVDAAFFTGDYVEEYEPPITHVYEAMKKVIDHIDARDGIFTILGNHDSADMVESLEALGTQVLVNETISLRRNGHTILITGLDDIHYFYSDAAKAALTTPTDAFKIALVHSAEITDIAAQQGYSLYLAGHTHGGQICLPGGIPLFTHIQNDRSFASGLWQQDALVGYTNRGAGTTTLPLRFFCPPEVAILTLRCR